MTFCDRVERDGIRLLTPFLEDTTKSGSLRNTMTLPDAAALQRTVGDFIARRFSDNQEIGIEVKTERSHTGNIFAETWSNYVDGTLTNSYEKRGWLYTLQADFLFAVFLSNERAYLIPFPAFRRWCINDGNLSRYREKEPHLRPQF